MSARLPLNALRAFEAVARCGSIARAAEELNVTPAAVSHQIRALEGHLGSTLFRRNGPKLHLTDDARLLLPGVREAFSRLTDAVALLARSDGELSVSAAPAFAARWLVPRVERFSRLQPGITVRISASMETIDFSRDRFDAAVRFGFGRYPGLHAEKLFDETIVPMCSPRLVTGPLPLREPADLRNHTLLHDESPKLGDALPDWRMWLKAAGLEHIDPARGLHFSNADHAIAAAITGAGVALSHLSLAADDLAAGRLVLPFALSFPVVPTYYVVTPAATANRPKIRAFREWLLAEAARLPGLAGET